MREVLAMILRRFLGALGYIPAVDQKIDAVADAVVDRLEAAVPAVAQIDEMLGATSQRNSNSNGAAVPTAEGMGESTFAQNVLQSDLPVLVDFWAPWCGPCRAVSPIIDELAQEYAGKINVVKVNIDEDAA